MVYLDQKPQSRIVLTILGAWLCWLPASVSFGQTTSEKAATEPPKGFLLPWQNLSVDPGISAVLREGLDAGSQLLAQQLISQPKTLKDFLTASSRRLTLNEQRLAKQIQVGDSPKNPTDPTAWVPYLCSFEDNVIIGLARHSIYPALTQAAAHRMIKRPDLMTTVGDYRPKPQENPEAAELEEDTQPPQRRRDYKAEITAALGQLLQDLDGLTSHGWDQKTNNLKVGLMLARSSSNQLAPPQPICLQALLAADLTKKWPVMLTVGANPIRFIHRLLPQPKLHQRATRTLTTEFRHQLDQGYQLAIRFSESVLACPFLTPEVWPLKLETTATQLTEQGEDRLVSSTPVISLKAPEGLHQLLDKEADMLSLQDKPTIVARDRGWVYLDRGRAWGLKMEDRLYTPLPGGDTIKGHVVGFYGTQLGLKTASGQPIREGAIVYMRKGYNLKLIGRQMEYDPTSYPTPWPPVTTPQNGN